MFQLKPTNWRNELGSTLGMLITDTTSYVSAGDAMMFSTGGSEYNSRASAMAGCAVYGAAAVVNVLRGHHLYNLMRPEFVATCPKPLSSDSFSWFGRHDAAVHNAEVIFINDYSMIVTCEDTASVGSFYLSSSAIICRETREGTFN